MGLHGDRNTRLFAEAAWLCNSTVTLTVIRGRVEGREKRDTGGGRSIMNGDGAQGSADISV